MKKIRYIIGVAAFALCSVAFAQQSRTYNATQSLYESDVDDYMSVTDFTNVEPENIFAFTNFYSGTPSFGVAKEFGTVYTGLYFSGWFNRPYSTSKTAEVLGTTYTGTIKGSGAGLDEDDINSVLGAGMSDGFQLPDYDSSYPKTVSMAALVGIKDIGIKLNLYFDPHNSYTLNWSDGTESIEYSGKSKSSTEIALSAGTKLDKETFVLTPWGRLSWTGYSEHDELVDKTPTETVTIKNNYGDNNYFEISGGVGMETKKEDLTHTLDLYLRGNFTLYDKQLYSWTSTDPAATSHETTREQFAFGLYMTPSYKLQFDPEERFSIALKAGLPIGYYRYSRGPEFEDNVQQDYEYSAVDFYLSPSVDVAARWFAIPDKLTVNLGLGANFNNLLGYSYHATAHSDAHNAWKFLDGGVSLSASTGVSFDFAKGITLDTSYNIVRAYNSELGTKLSDIWSLSNMSFQLSVKL